MGYRDVKLELSKSQALTQDAVSDNYIDTELAAPAYHGWEKGVPACIVVTIEAKTVAGTGVTFEVLHKTTKPSTDVIVCSVFALAADLAKGSKIVIWLPQGITLNRYLALRYNIVDTSERYTVSAYFSPGPV